MNITATKRLEWDSAHRITQHESKCWNLHGHRYAAEITCRLPAGSVNGMDMVVDFGVIKQKVGSWIDDKWDHGTVVNSLDTDLIEFCHTNEYKLYVMNGEPTAEAMAAHLLQISTTLLAEVRGLVVENVKVWETPTSFAVATR